MFGKLWEWVMGIIAWIMSKFSRASVASESVEGGAEPSSVQEAVQEPAVEAAVEAASQ